MISKFRILTILILFAVLASHIFAEDNQDSPTRLFIKAKSFYGLANYDEAIKTYEQILSRGFESGNLYYNLGNAYFKKGELGRAILNYQRARGLIPRDSDLKANYNFSLLLVKQNFSQVNKNFFKRIIEGYGQRFTLDEMSIIAILLYVFSIIIIILSFYFDRVKRYLFFIIPVIALPILLNTMALLPEIKRLDNAAIIVAKEIDSRFEPFDSATPHFRLFEGAEVSILEEKPGWFKIERSDGKVGWVNSSALERI